MPLELWNVKCAQCDTVATVRVVSKEAVRDKVLSQGWVVVKTKKHGDMLYCPQHNPASVFFCGGYNAKAKRLAHRVESGALQAEPECSAISADLSGSAVPDSNTA